MLKIVLIVLALALVLLLAFAATRPAKFHIERSVAIAASPAAIFPRLNDLRLAHEWAPWRDKDPQAVYTFDGPASGVGASQSWSGNGDIGAGRQTIVESRANERVRLRLDFEKPFAATCTSDQVLRAEGGQTIVTWTMDGDNNYLAKLMCLFMNQDKMIGTEFEKGLGRLKAQVETAVAGKL